jgi:hypothetical protein
MALELTQSLTEMSSKRIPGGGGGKEWPVRKADHTVM